MMELNTLRTWLEMAKNRLSLHVRQTGEVSAVRIEQLNEQD